MSNLIPSWLKSKRLNKELDRCANSKKKPLKTCKRIEWAWTERRRNWTSCEGNIGTRRYGDHKMYFTCINAKYQEEKLNIVLINQWNALTCMLCLGIIC